MTPFICPKPTTCASSSQVWATESVCMGKAARDLSCILQQNQNSPQQRPLLSDSCAASCGSLFPQEPAVSCAPPLIGFGKKGSLEKRSFQKNPFSRDSREFRHARVLGEPPDSGKQRRIRTFSRDSRDFRNSTSEKTPFVMTPSSGSSLIRICHPLAT